MIVNLLFAGSQLVMVATGDVPALQVEPSCQAAAKAAVALQRNFDNCMQDENLARDKLSGDWAKFSSPDKDRCMGMVSVGGGASYVELLSCLEMTRDARDIAKRDGDPLAQPLPGSATPRP